jgi:hypothetical protein
VFCEDPTACPRKGNLGAEQDLPHSTSPTKEIIKTFIQVLIYRQRRQERRCYASERIIIDNREVKKTSRQVYYFSRG